MTVECSRHRGRNPLVVFTRADEHNFLVTVISGSNAVIIKRVFAQTNPGNFFIADAMAIYHRSEMNPVRVAAFHDCSIEQHNIVKLFLAGTMRLVINPRSRQVFGFSHTYCL